MENKGTANPLLESTIVMERRKENGMMRSQEHNTFSPHSIDLRELVEQLE